MDMDLQGSRTEKNIMAAFAGESQARNRYTYFAGKARKEGYEQMALIFEETANQEREHAKTLFMQLQGGKAEIIAAFPAGKIMSTAENLAAGAAGENYEWTEMYPGFAEVAKEEGFDKIAKIFERITVAEKQHEKRYLRLLDNIKTDSVFRKDKPVVWRCLNCGYLHEGTEALDTCPVCFHPQAFQELLGENW